MNESAFGLFYELLLNFDEAQPSLPVFSKNEIINICKESQIIFKKEQTQLNLTGNYIIIGDLHGHVFDLIKIFQKYGLPPNQNYILLGDIVDRGDYSLAVVTLILILKVKYPNCIFLLRGNHEFRSICCNSGFYDEIHKIYKEESDQNLIFDSFIDVFNSLPLVACINNTYICVHGGIGPKFQKIDQLKNIVRPMNEIYGGIADEILWSDPSESVDLYRASQRGVGYEFGYKAISNFLKENKYRLLIRAHQQIQNGYEYSLDNQVLTVFSASNYCGEFDNFAGIIIIKEDAEKEEPVQIERSNTPILYEKVTFINSEERSCDLLKNRRRKGRSKSFRISPGKTSSSLPSFNSPKKKHHHHNHSKSILNDNISSSTPDDLDDILTEGNNTFNQNTDEVEVDPELGEVHIQIEPELSKRRINSSHKKQIQSLHLDTSLPINLGNWDAADPPRSLSARGPNTGMNLPFSIRSRKIGPTSRKLNFS